MMKNGAINSSKRACKILAERKLLSAVTVLQRDENWYFSIFIYLIINKLSFKKWHWKVPYSPQSYRNALLDNVLRLFFGVAGTVPGQFLTILSNAKNIERKKKYV